MQYSVVRYSSLERTTRLDSEYYQPFYLELESNLDKKSSLPLTQYCKISDGNHLGIAESFQDSGGVPYYRGQDLATFFIEDANPVHIPEAIYNHGQMKRSHFKAGDILLSIVGTVGSVSIITDKINKSTGSCKIAILRPSNVKSEYVAIFLKSKYGQFQIERNTRGAVQKGLILEDMNQIRVFQPSERFEGYISKIAISSLELNRGSKSLYSQAENIFLKELGLDSWKPKHQLSYVKNFSDAQKAERIDAEYFQPQYEEVESALRGYSKGYSHIKNEFEHIKTTFNTQPNKEYKYVEIGSVSVSNGEIIPEIVLGSELPDNAKRKLSKGQIVISKVRTYRGAITIIDSDDYVGSGAFTVLQEKSNSKINKETLLTLLKSKPLLAWSLKPNTGTSYPVIIDEDILGLPLPLIPQAVQSKIKENIEESGLMRSKSKALLEIAKKAVELAIEESEDKATKWIDSELTRLQIKLDA